MLTGRLVHAVAVHGQLSPVDAAVELIGFAIDLHGPDLVGDPDVSTDE